MLNNFFIRKGLSGFLKSGLYLDFIMVNLLKNLVISSNEILLLVFEQRVVGTSLKTIIPSLIANPSLQMPMHILFKNYLHVILALLLYTQI